jgi:putative ABC transport system substrate-binding protein
MAQKPDLVVPYGNLALATVKPLVGRVPVVFVGVGDPVGSGFVSNLARPGGTVTGFLSLDADVGGKWAGLLHEAVPGVTRMLALYEPENPSNVAMWLAVGQAALHYGIDAVAGPVHNSGEIERAVASFAATPGGGMVVIPTAATNVNLALLATLEERYRMAAITARPAGILSYGPDYADAMRRAAEYADRILKGEYPGDLPVQAPVKYVLTVNLKIAKALDVTIPDPLLIRADEVIE